MQQNSTNIELEWGITESPVGNMLIARSSNGIAHLSFLESDETDSHQQLRHDWPTAYLKRNDRLASEISHNIFSDHPPHPQKLDLRGTEFQLSVWKALLEIPRGQTTTYSQLAKKIGRPGAARAVGNAVGKNRIAYLIPCHRVIREDGSLGGFRWGTNCKSKLLAHEKS